MSSIASKSGKTFGILFAALVCASSSWSAWSSTDSGAAGAIQRVIELDDRLGAERNEAARHGPVAFAVERYVAGLDALDLSQCPPDFRRALRRHRDAWQQSIAFFEQFPDLRGEMHEVFEAIRASSASARAGLEAEEVRIWGTWSEVEEAMGRHNGARATDP